MNYKIQHGAEVSVITLEGDINEEIRESLDEIEKELKSKQVVFDCEGVRKINSIGVRDWMLSLGRLANRCAVSFVNCPEVFVDMAVMVPTFTRGRPIRSFYATYVCEDCAVERTLLVEIKAGQAVLPGDCVCAKCGGKLMPDEELESDIRFVITSA